MPEKKVPLAEFAARRKKLRTALKGAVGLVFAGEYDVHLEHDFRPHPHFFYLTGCADEFAAALLLDPSAPVESRREMLFLRPLNREVERWDGLRMEIGSELRKQLGVKTIFRLSALPRMLNEAVRRSRQCACLHPLAQYDQPVSPDLAVFRKVAERIPGVEIEDRTEVLAHMRSVKSSAEVGMLQRAIDITADGFLAMMKSIAPGMNEFDVKETLEHTYRSNGARELGFPAIAGSAVNSTVLHYRANTRTIEDGDLVCIDSGSRWEGYSADITRTVPANGTFTDRQREIYNLVLRAEMAAIKAVKPGVTMAKVDAAARSIISRAGFGDAFFHGIGHHLGLETHDITPDAPLKVGSVVTIEPGIYLPDEAIGVRIEDDILVTRNGSKNLSSKIPKRAADIERIMAER